MVPLLEIRHLVKEYPGLTAVNDISLTIEKGVCIGLLGPNGAGKTTTVEMLEGVLTPTRGEILFKGAPLDRRFQQSSGIMFQSTALQEFIKVIETLKLFRHFYDRTRPLDELIESCALSSFLEQDVQQLSGGQRQRVLLAIALINDPEILFLDEPTTGLDPQARRNFWKLIESVKAEQKTVVLTTHYMDEAYQLCDLVAIMDQGRIIALGSPEDLLKAHFDNAVITLPETQIPRSLQAQFRHRMHHRNGLVEIFSDDLNNSIRVLIEHRVSLEHLQVRSRTLEDLFLALTGHELRT